MHDWKTLRNNLLCASALSAVLVTGAYAATEPATRLTDEAIGDAVDDQLHKDPAVPAYRIEASAQDGIVTLTGIVTSLLEKERATRLAETVKGVRSVVNAIVVIPGADRTPREIERDIVVAWAENPATQSWELKVAVDENGAATISGTVDSWRERELAGTVAKGVRGVTALRNDVATDVETNRSDADIKADIEGALRWDAYIDNARIGVQVDNGAVILKGTVGSAAEHRRAIHDAWTPGVVSVDANQLVVAGWTRDPDLRTGKYVIENPDAVRAAVVDALRIDPRVDAERVEVSMLGNAVVLRGRVDSPWVKRAAEEDARNTVGVNRIVNRLKVAPEKAIEDAELANKVRAALVRSPLVTRPQIDIAVINGVVYLEGTADSFFEKAEADSVAAGVGGVIDVVNTIDVRRTNLAVPYNPYAGGPYPYAFGWYTLTPQPTFVSDAQIKKNIESELWWSPFVDSDDVKVSVERGVAILKGSVETWAEYTAARENAFEGGATWVVNDLSVTGEKSS